MSDLERKLEREGLKIASLSRRIFAYLLDNLILSLIVFIAFYSKFANAADAFEISQILGNFYLGFVILHFSYHAIFTYFYGASLGKMIFKIIILDQNTLDKPNFTQACLRAAVRQLSDCAFMLGFLWAFGNNLRKTWHDFAMRSIVVEIA